jgi:O-6-methylguanine DNA methyltransferase
MEAIYYKEIDSPVGNLLIGANDDGCHFIHFGKSIEPLLKKFRIIEKGNHKYIVQTEKELKEYFAGKLAKFSIKLALKGTAFQTDVWRALMEIPYGETASYKNVAEAIRNPKAVRAIGMANHANSIPIIIPCHRVINHNGSLGGFGGGLDNKRFLLNLELKNKGKLKTKL